MSNSTARLTVPARYTRSINLQRDFANDHVGVQDYQATPLVLETIERLMDGLQPESTARAFSVIGPYGSGKSAFGVFAAHYFRSDEATRQQLILDHSTEGIPDRALYDGPRLLPVLVSGNNTQLRLAALRSLQETLAAQKVLRDDQLQLPGIIANASKDSTVDPQQVADLFNQASSLVAERTEYDGLLIMIDELGQFLDYVARQGDERDLFVLQTLAEMAARSRATPCIVVTILHQAFDRYTGTAGTARRTEWAKVQGRFIDLPFQEPPIQMLRMVGRALCPDINDHLAVQRQQWADANALHADAIGLRPTNVTKREWYQLIARTYPLHPTVLVALPLLFRQLAQNERSLFAFLTSPQPSSLSEFIRSAKLADDTMPVYRLPHLYTYVHTTLGAALFGRARGQRWAELAEALAQLPEREGLLPDVLTTIGTLGALGQAYGLRANRDQVVFALDGLYNEEQVDRAINELYARKHISYRQHRGSYVIWEGSDLDLDGLIQAVRREVGDHVPIVTLLQQHADTTPRVARRHSYRTGAVRTFAVRFIDPAALASPLSSITHSDGEILYVVPPDDEALQAALTWVTHSDRSIDTQRIVVIPRRVRELRDLLLDVAALQRVLDTQPELEHDRPARRELGSRLIEAEQLLSDTIAQSYGPGHSRWFWCGNEHQVSTARQVDALLSVACDASYPNTPHIWNELIVRRQLSSAAAKARRNLIEAMLNQPHVEALGMKGYPPERAIYESVLRASGIHRQDANGVWKFGPPQQDDPLHLQPAWQAMEQFLVSSEGQVRPIKELYDRLESPPFGVKAGLTPLLFMAIYVAYIGQIALYEHGNYVAVPDIATFERLQRQSGYFAIRGSRTTPIRIAVYERLARALAPRALTKEVQPAVLDAVTPLLRLVHTLPPYARTTRRISHQAQIIRQALLEARAPDQLLFETLPQACGFPPFDPEHQIDDINVEPFFGALRDGLQELQGAYANLVDHVRERIGSAFGATTTESPALHEELTARYNAIAELTSDSLIRAWGARLQNANVGDSWIESGAALVAHKPLETWSDSDIVNFEARIAELGRQFKIAEQIAVITRSLPAEAPIVRVGLANGHGEVSTVVHLKEPHPLMEQLMEDLSGVLASYDTLSIEHKLAVLVELLRPNLERANGSGSYE